MTAQRKFKCYDCGYEWEVPYGTGRPADCPNCKSANIHRAEEDRGYARGRGGGFGTGRGPSSEGRGRGGQGRGPRQ